MLSWIARSANSIECDYVKSVGLYLTSPPSQNRELAFLPSFRGISPNVGAYEGPELPRVRRFEAINVLRNKIAHVPLPYEQLQPLHLGLQREVFSALHEDYRPENTDLNSTKWFSVLRGKLATKSCIINGSEISENVTIKVPSDDEVIFESGTSSELKWPVAPFIRPNAELKVSVLFRVPDFEPTEERLKIEYHRFAAESNAVKEENLPAECLSAWHLQKPVPPPSPEGVQEADIDVTSSTASPEPSPSPTPTPSPTPDDYEVDSSAIAGPFATKTAAINAYRNGAYRKSVELLLKLRDSYGHMWNDAMAQKLGMAYLRVAVESPDLTQDERLQTLNNAEDNLRRSLHHRDESYRADSHYELSKVWFRRFTIERKQSHLAEAKHQIEAALQLGIETRYLTWVEYLDRMEADHERGL